MAGYKKRVANLGSNIGNGLILVPIITSDKEILSLIDPGATASLIGESTVKELGLENEVKPSKAKLTSFTGEESPTRGKVKIHFTFDKDIMEHTFYVVSNLDINSKLLLGVDFLRKARTHLVLSPQAVKVSMFGKMLQLTSEGVQKRVYNTQEAQICTLKRLDSSEPQDPVVNMKGQSRISHRVILPRKTVANLKIKLPDNMSKGEALLEAIEIEGLEIPNQLITVRETVDKSPKQHNNNCKVGGECNHNGKKYAYIKCFNNSYAPITLKNNKVIGEVSKVEKISDKNIAHKIASMRKQKGIESDKINEKIKYINEMVETKGILDSKVKKVLVDLLQKYEKTVHIPGTPFRVCDTIEHVIPYSGGQFYIKKYPSPKILEDKIDAAIEKLLLEDHLAPSDSPFNNAFLPVLKPNGEVRICMDFCKLNSLTPRDRV